MNKIIAVDFDGTLCENKWPEIGKENSVLILYLQGAKQAGCKLILWTCRCGELLQNAVDWCAEKGLTFDAVNENLPENIEWAGGSDSRKIIATKYIDDKAWSQFLEQPNNWISVEDWLPPKPIFDWVLVQARFGVDGSGSYGVPHIAELRNGKWHFEDYEFGDAEEALAVKVTHWMPLPPNPDGDRRGES